MNSSDLPKPEHKGVSLLAIARTFGLISATAFGGGQMSAMRRAIVRQEGWIDEDEFLEVLSIAQLLPGANPTNVAVLVGGRVAGLLGAMTGLVAVVLPGFAILMVLAALVLGARNPMLGGALRACAAVAVGLTFANAVEMTLTRRKKLIELAIVVAVALFVVFLHASLWLTLLIFVPISLVLTRPRSA